MSEPRLGKRETFAFALPGLSIAWLIPPMYAILGDFYLRYTAATAAGIGTAMVLSKIIDAITDPPVGYLSDITETRFGARKPWMGAGVLLAIPMFWMFFNPPADAGNGYFLVGIVLYYLTYTLVKIHEAFFRSSPANNPNEVYPPMTVAERAGCGILLLFAVAIGIYPNLLTVILEPSLAPILEALASAAN